MFLDPLLLWPDPLSPSSQEKFSSLLIVFMVLLWIHSKSTSIRCLMWHSRWGPMQEEYERDNQLLCAVDHTLDGAQDKAGFMGWWVHMATSASHPPAPSSSCGFSWSISTWIILCDCAWNYPNPSAAPLHLTLTNFMMFSQTLVSSLSKAFQMIFLLSSASATSLSLVLSKCAEGLWIPLSMSPPKMSNRCKTSCKTNRCKAVVGPDVIPGLCANCIASFFLDAFAKLWWEFQEQNEQKCAICPNFRGIFP